MRSCRKHNLNHNHHNHPKMQCTDENTTLNIDERQNILAELGQRLAEKHRWSAEAEPQEASGSQVKKRGLSEEEPEKSCWRCVKAGPREGMCLGKGSED